MNVRDVLRICSSRARRRRRWVSTGDSRRSRSRLGTLQFRPGLAGWILIGGIAASLGGFQVVRALQEKRAQARFDAAVVESLGRLSERLRVCEDLLRGVRGFEQANGRLDRQRFRILLRAMGLDDRYPGLLGVSYGVPVPEGGLEALEERLRTEHGNPGLHIHPGAGFGDDTIVLYGEPEGVNSAVLGFNSASSQQQRASLIEARDSGELRASAPMPVMQAPTAGPGLILRLALYDGTVVPDTAEERREHFTGYVNAVFLLRLLAQDATGRLSVDGVRVSMSDVSGPGGPQPFLEGGRDLPLRWWHRLAPGGPDEHVERLVAGRRWALEFSAGPTFFHGPEIALPWIVGTAFLLIALLLAALVRSISRTGLRARDLADRMTEQLRRSESRLRAVTQVMPDGILVLDSDGRFIEVHNGERSGLSQASDELVGRTVQELLPTGVATEVISTIRRSLDKARVESLEYALDTARGLVRFEARVAPMGIEVDGRACVVWVARDVSERRAQEDAHLQAQKLEGLGLLAGGIAHDFNNLLTSIQGYQGLCRLAVDEGKDPSHFLERMDASIQRAASLARQLLAYSGHASFQVEQVDLNALVEEMSGLLGVSRLTKVTLEQDLAPGLPAVRGDPVQLQQVVMNLVTNASEAIGAEAGCVQLSTRATFLTAEDIERLMPGQGLAAGAYVTLAVRDNGMGMTQEVLARIFDPFFTTKPAGRGLGLSAMRGILRAHRAGIEIQSQPGRGTLFRVHFPVDPSAVRGPDTAHRDEVDVRTLRGPLLLAEDEPAVRDATRQMVQRFGMTVVDAADGDAAWAAFQSRPDLVAVILDLTMPRRGGAEVHRLIRAVNPRIPILLTSGYSKEAVPELQVEGHPTVFLQKPYSLSQLEAALLLAFERSRAGSR
jgi:PAS domain S-box-containing protein